MGKLSPRSIPVLVEKDEDGLYVVECPVFSGCYSQGKTVKEALRNISEVIKLCLEEKENRDLISGYQPKELTLHTVSV